MDKISTSRRRILRTTGSIALSVTAGTGAATTTRKPMNSRSQLEQAAASPPERAWSKTYSNHVYDYFYSGIEASDGDYVFAGKAAVNDAKRHDAWVVKVGPDGTRRWSEARGGNDHEVVNDIIEISDGYLLAGYGYPRGTRDWRALLMKISSTGDLRWASEYRNGFSYFDSLVEMADGDIIAAGGQDSGTNRGANGRMIRTSRDGEIKWEKIYGSNRHDGLRSIIRTRNDNLLVCGYYGDVYDESPADSWVMKTDSSGDIKWKRTFGTDYDNDAYSVIQTSDGGFLVAAEAGTSDDSSLDDRADEGWLIKLDSEGNKQWDETYGPSLNDRITSLIETRDGDYLFTGQISDHSGDGWSNDKFWLVKVAPDGTERWSETFSNNRVDSAHDLFQTSDGDYVMAGHTDYFGDTDGIERIDGWVVKLDVNDPPVAEFSVTNEPMVGRPVQFSASPASDPDGSIGAYKWDFTGDGTVDARGAKVRHTYSQPGEYTVRLAVTDSKGKQTSTERSITVAATPTPTRTPTASPASEPTSTPTARAQGDPSTNTQSLLGVGAGVTTLAGALAWWRRRGE